MLDRLKITLQYLMPKHALSRLVGKFAAAKVGFITTAAIRGFIKAYGINMQEAKHENAADYQSFNEFFTRPLKEGVRPLCQDENTFVHPVDGKVSQLGEIKEGRLFQAKGHDFSLTELLGGDDDLATPFVGGQFSTIYLAPKDYHRIHMPVDGKLVAMRYIPGDLFSVNPLTAQNVPNLFARNERVVCWFETEFGLMTMTLVGATIVASIETVWAGTVTPPAGKKIFHWDYQGDTQITLKKGEEMGRFKLGSTVILTFPPQATSFNEDIQADTVTRMGESFGTIHSGA